MAVEAKERSCGQEGKGRHRGPSIDGPWAETGRGASRSLSLCPPAGLKAPSEGWAAGAAAGPSGGEAVSDSVNYLLEIPRLERSPLNPFGCCSGHVCGGRGGAPVVKTWRSAGTLSKTAPARAPHKTAHSSFAERILL